MRLIFLVGLLAAAGLVTAVPVTEERRQTSDVAFPPLAFTRTCSHRARPTGTGSFAFERLTGTGDFSFERPTGSHTRRSHASFTGTFERLTGAFTFEAYPPASIALAACDEEASTGRPQATRTAEQRPQPTQARPQPTQERPVAPEAPRSTEERPAALAAPGPTQERPAAPAAPRPAGGRRPTATTEVV